MDRPLVEYYCSTSHNTYLKDESQIWGEPSVDMYIQAMQLGVRCVEIDVWPGGIVSHGPLGDSIPLIEVLKALRDHAWDTCPYPVILSIEKHADYMPLIKRILDVKIMKHEECYSLEEFKYQFLIISNIINISEDAEVDIDPTNLYRVYPSWMRLWSSNYDPRDYWAKGVQMCAINLQTSRPSFIGYIPRNRCVGCNGYNPKYREKGEEGRLFCNEICQSMVYN
jgi:hypothetical protein